MQHALLQYDMIWPSRIIVAFCVDIEYFPGPLLENQPQSMNKDKNHISDATIKNKTHPNT